MGTCCPWCSVTPWGAVTGDLSDNLDNSDPWDDSSESVYMGGDGAMLLSSDPENELGVSPVGGEESVDAVIAIPEESVSGLSISITTSPSLGSKDGVLH